VVSKLVPLFVFEVDGFAIEAEGLPAFALSEELGLDEEGVAHT